MRRSFAMLGVAGIVASVSGFGQQPTNAQMAEELAPYLQRVETELRGNILPYWLEHARDRDRGGFHGQLNDGSGIEKDAPRGALLTARILWTFSAAHRQYPDPVYLEMARWAYDDLMSRFWDRDAGGLFWSVTADGEALDPRKIIYVQSFGLYALAEYHLATGDRGALDHAIELYRVVEKHSHDRTNLGYFEEFSQDWKKLTGRGPGQSAMGSLGQKSQNTHLHMLEAYTNLLRAWPDATLKDNLRELIDVMLTRVMDGSTYHLNLFFDENWTPVSHEVSYGHDIEFSWLVAEAAEVLGDEKVLEHATRAAVKIAEVTLNEGVESDGSVVAEGVGGKVTNRHKDWWTQAEAAVGFANAYQLSGQPAFLAASLKTWDYIDEHLIDHKNGEWFIGINAEGNVSSPEKISFWKCPYHNGRACLELLQRYRAISEAQSPAH